ncbi:MAG: hypothetical protein ABSB89_01015 [Candidatus Bathyarchaeia archaeon]|jgi:hypothetical protein
MSTPRGIVLYLPLELAMLLQKDCADNNQLSATRVLWVLTEFYKDKLPKEVYETLHKRYELTALESRQKKQQKAQDSKSAREKEKEERERFNSLTPLERRIETKKRQLKLAEESGNEEKAKHLRAEISYLEKPTPHTSKQGRRK